MATYGGAASLLPADDHGRQLRRAVIASTIGTTTEWYDFFLYSTVTGLVLSLSLQRLSPVNALMARPD